MGLLWTLGSIISLLAFLYVMFKMFRAPVKNFQQKSFALFMKHITGRINAKLGDRKEELFAQLWDMKPTRKEDGPDLILLEIGAGSGANFKYYPKGVSFISVEPNTHYKSHLEESISAFPDIKLSKYVVTKGEEMADVPGNHCDVVVSTLVLCSVEDADTILREVKRVLKPGGRFLYLEHISAPPTAWDNNFQRWLNPLNRFLADGCDLCRHTDRDIDRAGFSEVNHNYFRVDTFMLALKYMLMGTARKYHATN